MGYTPAIGTPRLTFQGRTFGVWCFNTPFGGGIGLYENINGEWLGAWVSLLEQDGDITAKVQSMGAAAYIGQFIAAINAAPSFTSGYGGQTYYGNASGSFYRPLSGSITGFK